MDSFPLYQLDPHQPIQIRNFVPVDAQLAAPISLFNPQLQPSFVDVMGVGAEEERIRRRAGEPEQREGSSQVTSIDFLQAAAPAPPVDVSTGLALSLQDRRGSGGTAVQTFLGGLGVPNHAASSLLVDDEIEREIRCQEVEMDRFIKAEGERLRQEILEKVQARQLQILASLEEKILQKVREKELEVQNINQKNAILEEQMKQLGAEIAAWQNRAKYNENIVAALKYNLQQLYAQNRDINKEGCGDSEVDDTASCCNGSGLNFQKLDRENKDMKDLMICKVCRVNQVCMLLLPCRHVCLCKDCESKLSFCPLCRSSKLFGTEIYM